MTKTTTPAAAPARASLLVRIAERYHVDADKMMTTLKSTAFRQKNGEVTNEQMMALLIVADQYGLNPWTKEIYAFPDKNNGIVPVVGVDGWSRIINSHADFDGMDYAYSEATAIHETGEHKACPEWLECRMHRKDRRHPIVVREYLAECYRPPFVANSGAVVAGPWQSHTARMLRHKATIQCARMAFGFVGIFDEDEAERIAAAQDITPTPKPATAAPKALLPAEPGQTYTSVPVAELRAAADKAGLLENDIFKRLEVGGWDELPLSKVGAAWELVRNANAG